MPDMEFDKVLAFVIFPIIYHNHYQDFMGAKVYNELPIDNRKTEYFKQHEVLLKKLILENTDIICTQLLKYDCNYS